MTKFIAITKDMPGDGDKKPFMVAVDQQKREVLIFGDASQKRVREHVAEVQSKGIDNASDLSGEIRERQARNGNGTYLSWSLPEDRPRGGNNGGFRRNPIAELVGIAHHQAMQIVFEKRPPEDERKLSEFFEAARPHVLNMARAIAEDRLALQRELAQKS